MKLSDLKPEEWVTRLEQRRLSQVGAIRDWWQYYDGEQPLYYIAKILEEQQDRFPALTINWCEMLVDRIDARCVVEGFRLRGADEDDEKLWEVWQRNDLDEDQSENNVAALVTGVSYMMVGPGDEGAVLTVESPESVSVEIDPRTRQVIAAWKVWKSDPEQALDDMGELWLPGRLVEFQNGKPTGEDTKQDWTAAVPQQQQSQAIPVVPFQNRRRRLQGRSELRSLRPIVDGANQTATNMLAGVEHHAVPRKWILNAREEDLTDADGNKVPAWKIATGAVWAQPFNEENPDVEVKIGQFQAADLRNFHETISLLGRIGAGLCDLDPASFGFGVADNPASADGINAAKENFVRRVERVQTSRGSSYEKVMRLAAAVEENDPSKMVRLETRWRNPSTPTKTAQAQAAVATYGAGLSDLRQAREDYGYTDTQIKNMEDRESAEADNSLIARLTRPAPPGAGAQQGAAGAGANA